MKPRTLCKFICFTGFLRPDNFLEYRRGNRPFSRCAASVDAAKTEVINDDHPGPKPGFVINCLATTEVAAGALQPIGEFPTDTALVSRHIGSSATGSQAASGLNIFQVTGNTYI